jgi:RNA polymerase sigma-70 factor (ECF subfamily)
MVDTSVEFQLRLAEHRPWLLRQARWRLGARSDAAEDVVQETLVAAWGAVERLRGEVTRGWLAGILRHKVVDHWRRTPPEEDDPCPACGEDPFDGTGHWKEPVASWGNPEDALHAEGFWKVLEICARILPERMYRVFVLREVEEMDVSGICRELSLSESNCHVLLHRARLRLRGCVGERWGRG